MLASILLGLIGVSNQLVGTQIGLAIFYLIPIILVTLDIGRGVGLVFSVVSSLAWLVADLHSGRDTLFPLLPYWNAAVRLGFFVIVVVLLSAWKREKVNARVDVLTGMANRQAFIEVAGREIERCRRYAYPLTLGYVDCDEFKAVNDSRGHQEGDRLLRVIAQTLGAQLRAADFAARIGGDEFVVLIPDLSADLAGSALSRIREILQGAVESAGFPITFTIGVVTFERSPESIDEMILRADQLMYAGKEGGKNRMRREIVRADRIAQ
jgi:diguanylate cyclase (GGDEF)-like protein